jgi:hypothetical protein
MKDGQDTRFKRTFIVEYSTDDEVYAETLFSELRRLARSKRLGRASHLSLCSAQGQREGCKYSKAEVA